MVKKQLLFIQGGGHGAYDADRKLASNLQQWLGDDYHVVYPMMPDEERPEYEAWKSRIAEELSAMQGEAFVVGHSLGASFLLKYFSEERPDQPVAGLFLIASPYWGAEDWEVDEYALGRDFASKLSEIQPVFFYHSSDDEIVPVAHLDLYAEKLPQATIRRFDGRGHQFNNDLFEVAQDIKAL